MHGRHEQKKSNSEAFFIYNNNNKKKKKTKNVLKFFVLDFMSNFDHFFFFGLILIKIEWDFIFVGDIYAYCNLYYSTRFRTIIILIYFKVVVADVAILTSLCVYL